jgi:hypothetical protein
VSEHILKTGPQGREKGYQADPDNPTEAGPEGGECCHAHLQPDLVVGNQASKSGLQVKGSDRKIPGGSSYRASRIYNRRGGSRALRSPIRESGFLPFETKGAII